MNRRDMVKLAVAAAIARPAAAGIITQSGPRFSPVAGGGGGETPTQGTLATDLKVTSTAGGSQPFTFGHGFAQGDVPAGNYVVCADATSFQCDIRNRWPDGSAKYGVISGIATFTANVQKTFNLTATTTAPTGSDVAEGSAPTASVTFTGDVTGTYTLASVWGVDRSTWSKANGGRVRSIPGKVMSEFHYYVPTTDAHVAVWFYVRVYSNGLREIETVVENGWMGVSSPTLKTYSITVDINGSTVYTGTSLAHYHHTRWSRVDWHGTDPGCTPKHNAAYLRQSKLIPNYAVTTLDSAAYSGLASAKNPTPFALGNWSSTMGNAGYQAAIGLLPQWESAYCCETSAAGYAAVISNHRGSGRWPIHYRDENTGRVCRHSDYASTTIESGWGTPPPTASGGGPTWDIPHHPSTGYLPYLIEGRWPALESAQFTAMYAVLDSNPATRKNSSGATGASLACVNSPMTTRGYAWAVRSVGQAAAITPAYLAGAAPPTADANLRTSLVTVLQDTAGWAKANFIDGSINSGSFQNSIGWIGHYDSYRADTEWWGGSWMHAFQGMAYGHVAELGVEGITQATLEAVRDFVFVNSVNQGTASDTTWNWRRMATYDKPYLKSSSTPGAPVFMTPTEQYAAYKTDNSLGALTFASGSSLKGHSTDTDIGTGSSSGFGTGYGSLHLAVLSMAMDASIPGASAAYDLVTGASNFDREDADTAPQFSIAPRTRPAWMAGKAVNEWFSISGTNLSSVVPSNTYSGTPEARITSWQGAALKREGSQYIIGAAGGHGDYSGNDVCVLRLSADAPSWVMLKDTTAQDQVINDAAVYLDYRRAATHTYYAVQFINQDNLFAVFPAPGMLDAQYNSRTAANPSYLTNFPENRTICSFSFATNDWDAATISSTGEGVIADWPGNGDFTACLCCMDPSTGDVYYARNGDSNNKLWKWTRSTNTWAGLATSYSHAGYSGSAVDYTRGKILVIGDYAGTLAARILNTSNASADSVTFTGLGGDVLKMNGYPGVLYDEANDRFLVVKNTNPITIYTVSHVSGTTWDVGTLTTTGTAPAARTNGIQSSIQYVPELSGLVIANSHAGNVHFMRLV